MKHLLLLCLVAFIGSFSFAQTVPQKANTIVITLADSSNAYDKVTKAFAKQDFELNPKSKSTTTVSSNPKSLKNTRMNITADIKGAEVRLTGKILVAGQSNLPVEYKGNKGTPGMNAWEEMEKVAKALGGKVTYEVK